VVPAASDYVTIPAGSNVTISTSSHANTITTAVGSTLTLASGALLFESSGGTLSGTFHWNGTISGSAAVLTLAGTTTMVGATSGGDFANTGSMAIEGGDFAGSPFANAGSVTVSGGVTLSGDSTLTNAGAGSFTITDDSGFSISGGTFINEGTFTKSGGTGNSEFPQYTGSSFGNNSAEFENLGGTVNIDSGNFTLDCPAAIDGGQFNALVGSTLIFHCAFSTGGAFNVTFAGTLTGSGGGTIALDDGYFYNQAPGDMDANAVLDFPSGMVQVGNVTLTEAGNNTLTNTGYLTFVGSSGHGGLAMTNEGTIVTSGTSDLPLQHVLNGTAGVIDLASNGGLALVSSNAVGLTNKGEILKSAGTGMSVLTTTFFNDGGALDIESGSLAFQEHNFGYIAGPLQIATGALLDFETSNGVYIQGTLSSTGGGSVTMSSGWFDGPNSEFGEDPNATAALDFGPGKLTIAGGFSDDSVGTQFMNIGTIDFAASGGPLGTMYNAGTINFAGGQFDVEKGTGITNLPGGVINFSAATSLVTEAINCRIDNQGLIVVNAGSSTMDLATPYPYDTYIGAPALSNEGTFEVASGTLIYPSVSLDPGGTIPTVATYKIDAGATLSTEAPAPVTTNKGTVILQGLGAQFPAVASLSENAGTFAVLSGAVFSTAGNLTNTGTLTVGGNLTVQGNLTESATPSAAPVLDFQVAAQPNSANAPKLAVTGSTALAGKLIAEYGNGFAASAGSAYTVANFASAATGSFASTTGVGPDFTVNVNPTSVILDSTGVGAAQLDVTNVTAPATFSPGHIGPITWTVQNIGAGALGSWTDSVFLSSDGTVSAGDLLLGRVTHSGGLGAGASYIGSLMATFPAAAGTYKVVVESDSAEVVTQTSRAGDVGVSSSITSTLPALTLGGMVSGTLSAGENLLYTLSIPGGTDVRLSASFAAPALTDLEISRGAIPDSGSAEFRVPLSTTSATLATTIPQPQAGTYYILLQGQSAAGNGQSFTVTASAVAFGAFSVSPSTVGAGHVSLVIDGAGFGTGSTALLLGSGGTVVATATKATAQNPNTLLADVNLASVPAGTYSLKVTSGSHTTTLSSAIIVQPATSSLSPVQFTFDAPSAVRFGHIYDLLVRYTNPNNVDVPAPMFELTQPNAKFELVSGNVDANINADTSFSDGVIQLIAANQEGLAGTLPPNYTGVYDIRFTSIVNIPDSSLNVTLSVVNSGALFDLSSLEQPGPSGVSTLTAEILAAQINGLTTLPSVTVSGSALYPTEPNLNVTTGALNQYLDTVATELSKAGLYTLNVSSLLNTALGAADGFGAVTEREQPGPFGQGAPDPLLYKILPSSTGTFVDVVTPFGTFQFLQSGTTFTSADPLDSQTLSEQAGGSLRLTESDGSFFQFGANRLLSYYQTAGGLQVAFNYNATGQVASVVAPGSQTTSYSYNANGLVASSTDPFGNVTTYAYTQKGSAFLLTAMTTPAGTMAIAYTPTPSVQIEGAASYYTGSPALAYLPSSITLPNGSGVLYTYDGFGRVKTAAHLDGSDALTDSYDATGLAFTVTFADGSTESAIFGPGGIPLSATDALGQTTLDSYGPGLLLTSILSPESAPSTISYNAQGQPIGATSQAGTTGSLTYDPEGRVIGLTSANGNTTTATYDANSNLSSLTYPDRTQTKLGYNAFGQLDQVTGRDETVTNYTVTPSGLTTAIAYSDGTSTTFTYDARGNMLTSTDSSGTTTYTYNAAQEITSITYPGGQSVSYQYNADGQVAQESDQSGVIESYVYDSNSRLSKVLDSSGNLLVSYTYDDLGRISMETFGNGTKTLYGYDADANLTSISNLAPGGTVSSSFTYTYDAKGDVLTSTDQLGNLTTYTYDALGQLALVALPGGRTISYSYDADGNRTSAVDSAGTSSATYAANNLDQYTSAGSQSFTYYANGNLKTMTDGSGTTTYTYYAQGQLAGSTGPAGTFTYSYNSLGQLDSYTKNGVRTNLLLDASDHVIAAYDSSGNLIANYEYGFVLVSEQALGGSSDFYDLDVSGNTTAMTDAAGAAVNTYSYLPFGEKLSSTGTTANLFTFSGGVGVLDLGDGFYQTQNRTYSPALGRFLQPDPTGLGGGDANLYRYASNDPIGNIDPSGLADGFERDVMAILNSIGKGITQLAKWASDLYNRLTTGKPPENPEDPPPNPDPPPPSGPPSGRPPITDFLDQAKDNWSNAYGRPTNNAGDGPTVTDSTITEDQEIAGEPYRQFADASKPIVFWLSASGYAMGAGYLAAAYLSGASGTAAASGGAKVLKFVARAAPAAVPLKAAAEPASPQPTQTDPQNFIVNSEHPIFAYNSTDPNEIIGTSGNGANQYITSDQPLSYTVFFENEPTARAPAQNVTVTTMLSPDVDLSTFQLQGIGWGSELLSIPPGLTSYSTQVSYVQPNTGKTILVDVSAALNLQTRTLTWTFQSLDPATLDTPPDALAGFLPPDNSNGQGTGFVSYTVDPKPGLPSGTAINATASVVFDLNPALSTKTWTNIIDAGLPTSTVLPLSAVSSTTSFTVSWTAADDPNGSGLSGVTVYVSDNGGPFTPFVTSSAGGSAVFSGMYGHTYSFYSVATSNIGAVQPAPSAPEATITLVLPPVVTVNSVTDVMNKKHQVIEVIIAFSGAVNVAEAETTGIYRLVTPGKHRSYTAKNAGSIKLKRVSVNSSGTIVTLTPKKPFALTKPVQLVVTGMPPSGLEDTLGRFIDNGRNAVAILRKRSTTITNARRAAAELRPNLKKSMIDAVLATWNSMADSRSIQNASLT
jgi:RHS repeat-associated protein